MTDWHPIETIPRNEEEYLVCNDQIAGGFYQIVFWEDDRLKVPDASISYSLGAFTHWTHPPLTPTDAAAIAALPNGE